MSTDRPVWDDRTVPEFVRDWQEKWGGARNLPPTAFLDQEEGYPYVVAAAWLFCPQTFEYRGGIFLADAGRETVDRWFAHLGEDVPRVESAVNRTPLFDVFTNVDVDSYGEENLLHLARALGECWQGVLRNRYPDRDIVVTLSDEPDGAYGPTLSFAQRS